MKITRNITNTKFVLLLGAFLLIATLFSLWLNGFMVRQTAHMSPLDYPTAVENTDGLRAYWRLNGNASTVATDSHSTSNGTMSGSPLLEQSGALVGASNNTAVKFNGTDTKIEIPNASNLITADPTSDAPIAIEGWVNLTDSPSDHQGLFGFRNNYGSGDTADFYVLQIGNTNTIEARFRNSWNSGQGGQQTFDLTASVTPGQWHHIVFTRSGGLLELYIDGKLQAHRVDVYGSIETAYAPFTIGSLLGNYSSATIDEVALYNKKMTASDVKNHYNLGKNTTSTQPDLTKRWHGAWLPNAVNQPSDIDIYAQSIGTDPKVIVWYQNWEDGTINTGQMDTVASRDMIPMITWLPSGADPSDYTLAKILNGDHDAYIQSFAQAAANYNKPFFLRFAHEMNGNWYPWSPGNNGNTAEQYVQVWRKIHDIFKQAGADNVLWSWTPNVLVGSNTPTPMADLYPGDDYVDWIGLDGYNWGNQPSSDIWRSPEQVFQASYAVLDKITPLKPMMISEIGSSEHGGSKSEWITDIFTNSPTNYPRIMGILWFNENKERDWRINSSANSQLAFSSAVQSLSWNNTQTVDLGYLDWDEDSISNSVEAQAPNNGDLNNDGIIDLAQSNVTSFLSQATSRYVALEASNSCAASQSQIVAASTNDTAYTYPQGLMDFQLSCATPGTTSTVAQYYVSIPDSNYTARKFINGTYVTIPGATISRETVDGQSVTRLTYQVKDGGELDADGIENGVIVDPAGLAVALSSAQGSADNTGAAIGAPNTGIGRPTTTGTLTLLAAIVSLLVVAACFYFSRVFKR